MINDDRTIYKHEIDMLMRFFMVPGSENHSLMSFQGFSSKKINRKIEKYYFSTACSKSLKKAISDAQN